MDGTRAGRVAICGEGGSDGGLCTPCPCVATFDTFALTRTARTDGDDVGVFSSGCDGNANTERAGEDSQLISVCAGEERRTDDDVLPLRGRVNEDGAGVAAVKGRCRDSGNGDVELFPFVRAVRRDLTGCAGAGGGLGLRPFGGLNGDGERLGAGLVLLRTEGAVDTTLAGLRVWIAALLLILAFGRINGGERDVVGDLNGDAGRGRSTRTVTWNVA